MLFMGVLPPLKIPQRPALVMLHYKVRLYAISSMFTGIVLKYCPEMIW